MNEEEKKVEIEVGEGTHKKVRMLKAELSGKKGAALTWDEFFESLLHSERRRRDLKGWLYTIGIFIAITFVLMFPLYFFIPLMMISLIPVFILVGFIVAFLSAYILTPLSVRRIMKPFDNVPPPVLQSLEKLSKNAGIKKTPKLMLVDTSEINAFAYATLRGGRVCLSRGLMEAYQGGDLEEKELKAILAHELGHIRNRDCLKSGLVLSWISIFDTLGNFFIVMGTAIGVIGAASEVASEEKGFGLAMALAGWVSVILGFITKVIAKIASILAFHLNRRQEYMADKFAAELTSPTIGANALGKIEKLNNRLVEKELASLPYADKWQLQPRNPSWIDRLFDTHPPMDKRQASLARIGEFF